MPNIAIVTDSTCDMPLDWPGWARVHVAPISIQFEGEGFREGIDIDEATFYGRVDAEGIIPQTSQPSPGELAELYQRLSADHDAIFSIHIGGKLSGTYQSAMIAADMVKDEISVYPYDSNCGSIGLGFMVMEAQQRLDAGQTVEEIVERMDVIRDRMNIFLSPDTVKYIQMSGRISALGSVVASMLNIKPIIVLNNGELLAAERVRTRKRAMHRMVEMMRERLGDAPAQVGIAHARSPEDAAAMMQIALDTLNCDEVTIAPLATSIAVHLGPGTVGIMAYAK